MKTEAPLGITWKRLLTAFLFGLAFLCPHKVHANTFVDCDPQAFKDLDSGSSSVRDTLAVLSTVDKSNFSSLQDKYGLDVMIPIDGVPTDFGASINTFSTKLSQLKTQYNYASTHTSQQEYVSYIFSDNSTRAYMSCVKSRVAAARGLHVYVENTTSTEFTAKVYWNAGADTPPGAQLVTLDVTHSSNGSLSHKQFMLAPQGEWAFTVRRDPSEDVILVANLGKGGLLADTTVINSTPVITEPVPVAIDTFSITDTQPYTYTFRFDANAGPDSVANLRLHTQCTDYYGNTANGFFLSSTHRQAVIPNPNCSVWINGVFTVVDNPDWDAAYVRFYGKAFTTDKTCKNVDQYIIELPSHMQIPGATKPSNVDVSAIPGLRCS